MSRVFQGKLSGADKKFGIVASRFNEFITHKLVDGALDVLVRHDTDQKAIDVYWVPGSFEIPLVARRLAESGNYHAVICLGAVIRGATPHFEYVASEVSKGVAHVALSTGVPTIFGVITSDNIEQAVERAGTKAGNKGANAAMAALEMANLIEQLPPKK